MRTIAHDERYEIHPSDELYPPMLLDLLEPPKTLYVRGDPTVLTAPSFSIIGARKASPYGLTVSETAGGIVAEAGLVEVSGGARGCDQAGAWGALNAGGRHVAVLGGAADVVYPKNAAGLIARTIETGGAVVSLMEWGFEALPFTFPRRNRVIAALSKATLIAEAGLPSGTFSTAECALQIGREVLAVPGSILSPESKGTNQLISNGACCITDMESIEIAISRIYNTLRFSRNDAPGIAGLSQLQERAMQALVASPMRAEDLRRSLKLDYMDSLSLVSDLEVKGLISPMPDGRYSPTKFALAAQSSYSIPKKPN